MQELPSTKNISISTKILGVFAVVIWIILFFQIFTERQNKDIKPPDAFNMSTPGPRFGIITYKTVEGDTVEKIANSFFISIDTVRAENNLKGNEVPAGKTIRILPVSGVTHVVQKGDTIYTIAARYKVDPQNIINFPGNTFASWGSFTLVPGTSIIIPDGKK